METAANLHAVPHWERINSIKSRVDIAFDLGVDPAKTNAAQLRRALFATLNNDVLPQMAKAAPAGADLHAFGKWQLCRRGDRKWLYRYLGLH